MSTTAAYAALGAVEAPALFVRARLVHSGTTVSGACHPRSRTGRTRSVSAMMLQTTLVRLRAAFWVLPTLCAVAAGVLAPVVARLDEVLGEDSGLLFAGGPDSARQILGVIASSVLTFAGLAFSITIVALQLASSQFSPRVLRSMLRDRWTQAALGVFVGTFVFSLLTLREVRSSGKAGAAFVPGLGVTVSLLLGLASIGRAHGVHPPHGAVAARGHHHRSDHGRDGP